MLQLLTKNRFYYSFIFFLFLKTQFLTAQCPVNITTQPVDASACTSGGTATFSVTATGDITGYQWQVNTGSGFTNVTNGVVYSGATTASLTIAGLSSESNGYQFRCLIYNNCGPDIVSDEKTLTITPNEWIGGTSANWADATNWSCGVVPTNHDDVNIYMSASSMNNRPTITSGTQGYCRSMTFNDEIDGLTFNGATLNVSGDLTLIGGTFYTNNASLILFNGVTTQHLNSGWLVVTNLTLSNGNNLVVDGSNITVNNTLKINSGKIILNNNILEANNFSNTSDTRYVCTCDEMGTPSVGGGVRKTIASSGSFTFPVGSNLSTYAPITITNTSGPAERFMVSVDDTALPGSITTEAVKHTWHIEEDTPGGNTGSITLQWNVGEEGGSFNRASTNCRILKSDGTNLVYNGYPVQAGAASSAGSGIWTKTLTGITEFSPWGVTSQSCTPVITTQPTDATICAGGNTSFTITATGAIINYQWQVNTGSGFTDIVNNSVYSGANTTTLNITGAHSTFNGYLYKCIVYDACGWGIASNNKTLTVTANTWTGTTSTDWANPANWSCGVVPTSEDDVTVLTNNTTNNCVVASGTQAYCRNMTRGGNFFRSFDYSNATINISGNLTYNGGVFTSNSSSYIHFNGTTTQYYGGTSSLVATNLTIDNDLVTQANLRVNGTLNLSGGRLIINDKLLEVNNIASADMTHFIAFCDETGTPASVPWGVRRTIGAGSSFEFPIAPNLTDYSPVTVSNTSGPSEEFLVNVAATPLAGGNAAEAINQTWTVEETTAGGNIVNLTFQWNEGTEGGSFNRNNCSIFKTDGANVIYTGYNVQMGTASSMGSSYWSKTVTGVTAFSQWGVSSQASLPIELLKFKADILNKNTAQITWEITANSTPQYFEVLKSENGKDYKSIGYVKANSDLTYTFKDENLKQGVSYFKLKMTDIDNTVAYSKVVSLVNAGNKTTHFTLVPNLVTDKTNVIFDGLKPQNAQIHIMNTNGQLVKRVDVKTDESYSYQLDCADLLPGIYFVQIVTEGGATYSNVRLMKQ